jgi:hypothetical protein
VHGGHHVDAPVPQRCPARVVGFGEQTGLVIWRDVADADDVVDAVHHQILRTQRIGRRIDPAHRGHRDRRRREPLHDDVLPAQVVVRQDLVLRRPAEHQSE